MLESKKELSNEHTFGSRPSWWPLMRRGVAYWIAKENNVSFMQHLPFQLFICLFVYFQGFLLASKGNRRSLHTG